MGYDWEKIFENKTNKELYEIATGKRILSKDAVKFAKQELESRNFDFENMDANKAAWEISSIIEEEDYARLEITGRRAKYIPLNILLLIVSGIIIVYFAINNLTEYEFPIDMAIIFSGIATLFILLNNFQAKKQNQKQKKRFERIKKLKEKLENENLLTKDSPIHNEIIRHRIEETKGIKTISYIMTGISAIMLLIYILSRIL